METQKSESQMCSFFVQKNLLFLLLRSVITSIICILYLCINVYVLDINLEALIMLEKQQS